MYLQNLLLITTRVEEIMKAAVVLLYHFYLEIYNMYHESPMVNICTFTRTVFLIFLQNGVRGLMLDMYDFRNDVWLCHSTGGQCYNFTAFVSFYIELILLKIPRLTTNPE